jgi:hypothetical protein
LVYADYVNILGGSVNTIKENAEALVVASKGIGVEVNADKTMYMVMSCLVAHAEGGTYIEGV